MNCKWGNGCWVAMAAAMAILSLPAQLQAQCCCDMKARTQQTATLSTAQMKQNVGLTLAAMTQRPQRAATFTALPSFRQASLTGGAQRPGSGANLFMGQLQDPLTAVFQQQQQLAMLVDLQQEQLAVAQADLNRQQKKAATAVLKRQQEDAANAAAQDQRRQDAVNAEGQRQRDAMQAFVQKQIAAMKAQADQKPVEAQLKSAQ